MGKDKSSDFSERLRDAVAQSGFKRKDLAIELGVSYPALTKYLSGEREPDISTIVAFVETLNVDANLLLTGRSSEYAEIGNTIGFNQSAIDTLAALKAEISPYSPNLSTAEILSIALSSETFVRALVAFLCCADVRVGVYGGLTYQKPDVQDGIRAFGESTIVSEISAKVPLKSVLRTALSSELQDVRTQVQKSIEEKLLRSGYIPKVSRIYRGRFHKKEEK